MAKKKTTIFDWLVRAYDKKDNVKDAVIIKQRTEHEAEKEAQPTVDKAADWTMVKMEDELKHFCEEWGQDDDELASALEVDNDDAFTEYAINHDYIWVEPHNVWVSENSRLYDKSDDLVIEYIKQKKHTSWK
jgi:hypothetical protein